MEPTKASFRKKKIRRNTDTHATGGSRFTYDFDNDEGLAIKKKKKMRLKGRSKSRVKKRGLGSTMNIVGGRCIYFYFELYYYINNQEKEIYIEDYYSRFKRFCKFKIQS